MNFHGANVLAWCVEFVQMLVHRLPVLGDRVGVFVLLDSRGGLPRRSRRAWGAALKDGLARAVRRGVKAAHPFEQHGVGRAPYLGR